MPDTFAYSGDHPERPYGLHCARCGAVQDVTEPLRIDDYEAAIAAFRQAHAECEAREGATTEMESEGA